MKFIKLDIEGAYLIEPRKIEDSRGVFFRTYDEVEFEQEGLRITWRQANHSFTSRKGMFRGIHYQVAPYQEYKLIRCIAGSVIDFGVDLRKNSPTLFRYVSAELSASNGCSLLLPPGVGHAFQTLEDHTALVYMHSQLYMPSHEGGVLYNDEKIKLPLPLSITEISDRDKNHAAIPNEFDGIDYK